jgi:L-alanine-DL-glutamate epimerase-like enolase superfamily enzyme
MKLTRLTTESVRVPLGKPTRVPLTDPRRPGGPDAVDLVIVSAETDAGPSGLGFTHTLGPGAAAVRGLIDTELSQFVVGEDARDAERLFAKAEAKFRHAGFAGLAARAYSAIDVALWDLKAKAAELPLWKLLGGAREAAPFFVSDAAADAKAAKAATKAGAMGLRVEIGHGPDVQADADRIREIQDALGEDGWLGVAAGGRFDLGTAQALSHFFEDVGIDWFEDPIPASDVPGYARLAALMEVPLAVGSGFDSREAFFRVIRDGVVRTVRPDVARIGGITPFLKVAAVAEAYHVAVSPVRMPEVGVHLACGLGVVPHVDWVSWFADVFTGGANASGGKLVPGGGHGLGIARA